MLVVSLYLGSPLFGDQSQETSGDPVATAPAEVSPLELVATIAGQVDAKARREAAVQILRMSSPEGIRALLFLFESKNNEAAKQAICEAIAEVKSQEPAFLPPLLALLENRENPALRKAVVAALSVYRDPAIAEKLQVHLQRQMILELMESHVALMRAFYDRTPEAERPSLLQRWMDNQPLAIERLTALDIVHQAIRAGTPPSPAVLEKIRNLLQDPDADVRQKAIRVLRDHGLREDATGLQAMLEQEQPALVREAIYNALGHLGDATTMSVVIKGLTDPSENVAAEAATAVGRLAVQPGAPQELVSSTIDPLLACAAQPISNPRLRERVIGAMSRIGAPEFLPVLLRHAAADEPVSAIRQVAVSGMGRSGDSSCLPAVLERLSTDPDGGVREAAAETLGRLGNHPDHLRALRERLDPNVEPLSAVQNRVWEAYGLIFAKLALDQQRVVLESWNGADATATARRIELLALLERQLSTNANGHPKALAEVREQLGDALLAAGRPAQAVPIFTRSLETVNGEQSQDRARVALKLIEAHLQTPALETALTAAAAFQEPTLREAAAGRFLSFATKLIQADPQAATNFLDNLRQTIPDQFGAAWAEKFDAARQSLSPAGTSPTTGPAAG